MFLVLFSFFLFFFCVFRASNGANPEISENDLGTLAVNCASKYCKSKDSLELWLSIEWDCHFDDIVTGDGNGPPASEDEVEIVQAQSRKKRRLQRRKLISSSSSSSSSPSSSYYVSRIVSGFICSLLSLLGLSLGFLVGARSLRYKSIEVRRDRENDIVSELDPLLAKGNGFVRFGECENDDCKREGERDKTS